MMNQTVTLPEQARTLIREYFDSEWRTTRLEVLKALGQFQDSRSFQFLVQVIQRNEDLAEQQFALLSLSRRKNSQSARFLKHYYFQLVNLYENKA